MQGVVQSHDEDSALHMDPYDKHSGILLLMDSCPHDSRTTVCGKAILRQRSLVSGPRPGGVILLHFIMSFVSCFDLQYYVVGK